MTAPSLMLLAVLGLTAHRDSRGPIGSLTISGTVNPGAEAMVTEHDLGGGVFAQVATYREYHTMDCVRERIFCRPDGGGQAIEVLAYAGDRVSFDAATQLVATRSGPDLQEIPTRIARAYFGSTRQ